jgi:trans-2,3-dihydro-3-hydroxyanthranilate isomerase
MIAVEIRWLDVFTDVPFAGNPLAVVPDADALSDEDMQAIARELGLSETVFVLGGAQRLRIFTPSSELPLAGHPVVGATLELARMGRIASDGVHTFETLAGEIPVEVSGGAATMTQTRFEVLEEFAVADVASWLRIDAGDVIGTPRCCTTTGVRHLFVRVRDRDAVARIEPDLAAIAAVASIDGVAPWCEHGDELAQRFFAPQVGVPEDPATGSAAGALGALRVHEGAAPGEVTVRQGAEIGRPSEIRVEVGGAPGAPEPPRVGGRAVPLLVGELRV